MAEATYLVTLEQAGFDILYALMACDGHIDDNEIDVIKEFLHTERVKHSALFNYEKPYYGECNYLKERDYLKVLEQSALKRRFTKAVQMIAHWIQTDPNAMNFEKELTRFAVKMIMADGLLADAERELIDIIAKEWNLDTDELLKVL
ncbi:MAG: hypothetical protein A2Y33_09085 [Spirochaetes bacterium GWF1_51_8]|nr:MAG: hypothetical protein A2Y33_09085 [Spirochaetes bacterium GWF1_51_8]